MHDRRVCWGVAGAALLLSVDLLLAVPAIAQIDEIIVTARKREESLYEVPVAVTVLGEQAIEAVSPADLQDLTGLAPNMFIGMNTAGPGASAIFSRGQGYADIEKTQNPAVGVSIDGMFIGTSTGQLLDAFDVSQVEVNRGPQGLLFGKNTTAGVIDVKRTRPTGEWGAKGSVSYGSYGERILKAVVNSQSFFNDLFAVKLGATYRAHDGYYSNLYSGGREGEFSYTGGHAMVSFDPTEWFDGLFVYDFIQQRGDGQPVQNANQLNEQLLGTAVANPGSLDAHQVVTDFDNRSNYDAHRISAEFNIDTPIGALTSITAYFDTSDRVFQDFEATCRTDLLGLGCPVAFQTNPRFGAPALHTDRSQEYDQLTQEVRLVTDLDDLFGGLPLIHGAILTTGGYYFGGDIQLIQQTDAGVPVPTLVSQVGTEQTRSYAGFAAGDFELTERLSISIGGRFIREEKDFSNIYFNIENLGPAGTNTVGDIVSVQLDRRTEDAAFEAWTTKFGIDYQILDEVLAYFSRSEGFRSGGFSIRATGAEAFEGVNSCAPDNAVPPTFELLCPENNFFTFEPEKNTTYEAGIKGRLFEDTLLANLLGFWQKVENYQVSAVTNTPGFARPTSTYVNNFQETGGWGIEAEFVWDVPMVEGLSLSVLGGYQDLEIKEALVDARRLPVGPGGQPGSPAQGLIDLSDTELARTPDFQYSLSGTYERPLFNDVTINTSATWRYQDDFVIGSLGSLTDVEDGYGLLDARVSLIFEDNLEFSVIGKNLTNEDYRNNSLPAVNFQGWGNPTIITFEIKGQF